MLETVAARTRALMPRFTDRTGHSVCARTTAFVAALGSVFLVVAAVSVSLGPVEIPLGHVVSVLVSSLGIELAEPDAKGTVTRFREAGVLLGTSLDRSVVRLLPPLTLTIDDLDPFFEAAGQILGEGR